MGFANGALALTGFVAALSAAAPATAGEAVFGAFEHASNIGISAGQEEEGVDLYLSYRTERIERIRRLGRPRAAFSVSHNLSGDTNFAVAGLVWRGEFGDRYYGQFGFGLAVHDGEVSRGDVRGRTDKIAFGSRVLFQEDLSLGVHLSPRWAAEAAYVHYSNGHIWTDVNPGMDSLGLRLIRRTGP